MIKVNAIGQVCPVPIIMTKNALKKIDEGKVEISVDNEVSLQNLEKFSQEMGYSYDTQISGEIFRIIIDKKKEKMLLQEKNDKTVIVIDSLTMGNGDLELGKILLKGFIYTLTEYDKLPKSILLYNEGVKLVTTNSESLDDLLTLEARGVEILACGACLNFYNLTKEIRVGSITNMYSILDKQMNATKVIKP